MKANLETLRVSKSNYCLINHPSWRCLPSPSTQVALSLHSSFKAHRDQALRLKKEVSECQSRTANFEAQIQELEGQIQVGSMDLHRRSQE